MTPVNVGSKTLSKGIKSQGQTDPKLVNSWLTQQLVISTTTQVPSIFPLCHPLDVHLVAGFKYLMVPKWPLYPEDSIL